MDDEKKLLINQVTGFEGSEEIVWLIDWMDTKRSRLVFCQSDLNPSNILIKDHEDPSSSFDDIMIVDTEYCCYNSREADLASYFIEMCHTYFHDDIDTGFIFTDDDKMMKFVECYIE